MGRLGRLALFGALLVGVPQGSVFAADMPAAYAPPVPYELASAWYLRGDLGYKWYTAPDAHFDVAGYGHMKDTSMAATGLAGFGFGYQFNPHFRSDLTLDYEWPSEFHGKLKCPGACSGKYSNEYASIDAWTTLFNVYYDIGTWNRFTPYLGAGIGTSYLTSTDVHYRNPGGATGKWSGASEWNFAWQVTAGASYALNNNWVIDTNYRFVGLGNAVSGKTSIGGKPIHYDNIMASELRVGLRFLIN